MAGGVDEIIAAIPAAEPTLASLEELVRLAERRVRRASEKRATAIAEETAAVRDLHEACSARDDWIATSPGPDPQLMML